MDMLIQMPEFKLEVGDLAFSHYSPSNGGLDNLCDDPYTLSFRGFVEIIGKNPYGYRCKFSPFSSTKKHDGMITSKHLIPVPDGSFNKIQFLFYQKIYEILVSHQRTRTASVLHHMKHNSRASSETRLKILSCRDWDLVRRAMGLERQ